MPHREKKSCLATDYETKGPHNSDLIETVILKQSFFPPSSSRHTLLTCP